MRRRLSILLNLFFISIVPQVLIQISMNGNNLHGCLWVQWFITNAIRFLFYFATFYQEKKNIISFCEIKINQIFVRGDFCMFLFWCCFVSLSLSLLLDVDIKSFKKYWSETEAESWLSWRMKCDRNGQYIALSDNPPGYCTDCWCNLVRSRL